MGLYGWGLGAVAESEKPKWVKLESAQNETRLRRIPKGGQ